MGDRAVELRAIPAFVESRGVARCPPGYAGAVDCALPRAEERARLARLEPLPPLTLQQIKDRLFWALKASRSKSRR
jgi:hypothetical protein